MAHRAQGGGLCAAGVRCGLDVSGGQTQRPLVGDVAGAGLWAAAGSAAVAGCRETGGELLSPVVGGLRSAIVEFREVAV